MDRWSLFVYALGYQESKGWILREEDLEFGVAGLWTWIGCHSGFRFICCLSLF